jgi:hypothetical protein
LDPIFYTGYAINLDDALAAAGNHHYFVTRWSSYMPQYVFCQIFGAYWGRIALRLVMLAILSEVFWRVGNRFRFSAQSRIMATLLVFMMPMFVRAFTTDYQEYSSTFYGILLVTIACTQAFDPKWTGAFGALAALMVISNPNNVAIIGICALCWFISRIRQVNLLQFISAALVAGISGATVVVFGYLLFKYHYRIGNVYTPTIEFMRNYVRPRVDLWTAPGREWVGKFGWLYIPIGLVVVSQRIRRRDRDGDLSILRRVQIVTLLVFLYHVVIQIRSGHALETGFYWAMALPPVFILFYLLCAWIITNGTNAYLPMVVLIGIIGLIRLEVPQHLKLGSGIALGIAIAVFILLMTVILRFLPALLLAVLVIGTTWIQIGSPRYDALTYGGDSNTPRYDLVYGNHSKASNSILHETIWFTEKMDTIPDDWKSTFMSVGGWSSAIIATYIPHPFSRWIVASSTTDPLTPQVREELEFGRRKYLVVFGDPQQVGQLISNIRKELPRSRVVLDVQHRGSLGYRLVAVLGNAEQFADAEILPSQLQRNVGSLNSDGSVSVPPGSPPGFATFGPYFSLGAGHYVARLTYETTQPGDIGSFEVFNDMKPSDFSARLRSSGSGVHTTSVEFEVLKEDSTWQLRTEYLGKIAVRFIKIQITRLSIQ